MKVSNCCGVPAYSNGDADTEDMGICPDCKEHCEYVEEGEGEELNTGKLIKVCDKIIKDAKDDATNFDGQPFTGKTVGSYMGYHGAAIATLADILKQILKKL